MVTRWINEKKYKNKEFKGSYERKKNGQRIFNLAFKDIEISFEGYGQAKKLGWILIKK